MFSKKKDDEEQINIINKAFSKYLDKRSIDNILSQNNSNTGLKNKNVGFIIIKIKDDDMINFQNIVIKIINISLKNDWIVYDNFLNMIALYYGILDDQNLNGPGFMDCLNELNDTLLTNISFVYGTLNAYIGNIGTEKRMFYSVFAPKMHILFDELQKLNYGETKDFAL